MDFIDLDELENDRNFWYASLVFLYSTALVQFVLDNFLLGVTTMGTAITISVVAHQKLNEK